jgi:hypothetical protein
MPLKGKYDEFGIGVLVKALYRLFAVALKTTRVWLSQANNAHELSPTVIAANKNKNKKVNRPPITLAEPVTFQLGLP